MGMSILIKRNTIDIPKFKRVSEESFKEALEKTALQWLTWCNNGSPTEPATPPIRWGVLRGSSSVFVADKMVSVYDEPVKMGANEVPDPARSYNGEKGVITIVYNTVYAFKMHEERGKTWHNLGVYSAQAANATDKWLEKHIANDGKPLFDMLARLIGNILNEKG